MRILFIAPYTPLLTKPRPFNFILHLSQRHEIYLLCFEDLPQEVLMERPDYQHLRASCRYIEHVPLSRARQLFNCASSIPTGQPLRVAYYRSKYMRERILALIERHNIDVVHVDRSRLSGLVRDIPLPKVLDITDSISWYLAQCIQYVPLYLKPVYLFEFLKMRRYELTVGCQYDQCLITSPLDLTRFQGASFYNRINIVPNTVNQTFFSGRSNVDPENTLLFYGNMFYYPNVDAMLYFCRDIYPLICREIGSIHLHIVGNRPSRLIRRLQRDPRITVTGYVSSILDYLSRTGVVISPMRIAVGSSFKIAEALAMGKAIVSTVQGCRGLPGSEEALLSVNDPREFAEGVINLIGNSDRRRQLERSAQRYAQARLHPAKTLTLLDDVYAKL
jgi:glycosyltransferase involved in cell wall biosynthesis